MEKDTLTSGSLVKGFISFLIPLMLGQFLQQLYNLADAWVIGNFADNASFAAVSSCGNLSFLIVGFFIGISNGAGVVIARYFGARDLKRVQASIRTTFVLGICASILVTILTTLLAREILVWMQTPDTVLELAVSYFTIYCMGISTIIMYNLFMTIMRALGDSMSPLLFLCISSVINVVLDLIFVALLHKGVAGAALATVIAQGISAVFCFLRMQKRGGYYRISLSGFSFDLKNLRELCLQGLPAGIQNSALSVGNVVVQSQVNSFGEYAMAGQGAHVKIEGFVFIPIICISMALSTFVSQNRGAGNIARLKKGAVYAVIASMAIAQAIGAVMYLNAPIFLRLLTQKPDSIAYGIVFARIVTLGYLFLAFTHAASGIIQGLGKAMLAMINMMSIWGLFRVIYVTIALSIKHDIHLLALAYPITWILTSIIFLIMLLREWKKLKSGNLQELD